MIIYCLHTDKYASYMNLLIYVLYYNLYTPWTHVRPWPLLLVKIDIIGQSIIVHAQCIHHELLHPITFVLSLHKEYSRDHKCEGTNIA